MSIEEMQNHKQEVVLVAPNGASLEEHYVSEETVNNLLAKAVRQFGQRGDLNPDEQYVLVKGDTALEGQLSLRAAGVEAGDRLKIRSKKTPGDGCASRAL